MCESLKVIKLQYFFKLGSIIKTGSRDLLHATKRTYITFLLYVENLYYRHTWYPFYNLSEIIKFNM